MAWALMILGAILATAVHERWWLSGALIGWLIGDRIAQRQRVKLLEERIAHVELQQARSLAARGQTESTAQGKRTPYGSTTPPRSEWPMAAHAPPDAPAPAPASVADTAPAVAAQDLDEVLQDVLQAAQPAAPVLGAPVPPMPSSVAPRPAVVLAAGARPAVSRLASAHVAAAEAEPGALWTWLEAWARRANWPVVIGGLMLFVGLGALLKYAVDAGWFTLPPVWRVLGIALAAVAALVFAWRQRHARRGFALALQGVALGVLLIDVYAALRLFQLVSAPTAFALMVAVVVIGVVLALLQDALILALLSAVGGFAAPALASTGSGHPVALFSYLLVLNTGILAVALVRRWPWLMRVGFLGTFVLASLWGWRYYQPYWRASVEPFLIAFVLLYIALAVLSTRRSTRTPGEIEPGLVFATPLVGSVLMATLWPDNDHALALRAFLTAAVYGGLWLVLPRTPHWSVLRMCFLALAVVFSTLAIPLAFGARVTSACYALEGAALVGYALWHEQRTPLWLGLALQVLAGVSWFIGLDTPAERAWINGHSLGALLLALSAGFSGWRLDRHGAGWLAHLGAWATVGWAVLGMGREADQHAADPRTWALLLGWSGVALVGAVVGRVLTWDRLRNPLLALAGVLGVGLLWHVGEHPPGLSLPQLWLVLAVSTALIGMLLTLPPTAGALQRSLLQHLWQIALCLVIGLDLAYRARQHAPLHEVWALGGMVLPWLLLGALSLRAPSALGWPQDRAPDTLSLQQRVLIVAVLGLALVATLGQSGRTHWTHLPLLNPLELLQLALLLLLWRLGRAQVADDDAEGRVALRRLLLGAAFTVGSLMVVRAVAMGFDLGWSTALWDAREVQTALALCWALLGVVAMVLGNRWRRRLLWRVGAALMGVVAIKLLLIDRQYLGSLAGISAFIGVGVLLVAVAGYFAPAPTDPEEDAAATE